MTLCAHVLMCVSYNCIHKNAAPPPSIVIYCSWKDINFMLKNSALFYLNIEDIPLIHNNCFTEILQSISKIQIHVYLCGENNCIQ